MPSTSTTTMLAVVKPEAAPGAEIREVKIPGYGRTDVLWQSQSRFHLRHRPPHF